MSKKSISLDSEILEKIEKIKSEMPGNLSTDQILLQALEYYRDRKVLDPPLKREKD